MISVRSRSTVVFLKVYVAGALVVAAILSRPALSFIPILLLASYLLFWRWRIRPFINLLADYFIFFAIVILLAPFVNPFFALLISLPVLLLITGSLEETAESLSYRNTGYVRSPTSVGLALPLMALLALVVSSILGSLSLLLVCVTTIVFFGILGAISLRRLRIKPVEETQVKQRMVAEAEGELHINLTAKTDIGGLLFVESPYEWLRVSPNILSLKENELVMKVSLRPPLSGPSVVKLMGHAIDRWGLIQTRFELEPIRLYVIPRARYASWLARRYLAETKPGFLPLISSIGAVKPMYGLRRGVEYYGSQRYQPGDSLKNMDWKHTAKYNELITKEFSEFHGQPAVILINLAASDAEEADKLAYKIIVTAISLARENIPAALAAYDHEDVRITTGQLQPRELLLRSLEIAQKIVVFINPFRYLNPPDVTRLRADMTRIKLVKSEASEALGQLLQLEYKNLSDAARLNPVSEALSIALGKAGTESNILVVSQRNHDAEALTFSSFSLTRKGNAVINV